MRLLWHVPRVGGVTRGKRGGPNRRGACIAARPTTSRLGLDSPIQLVHKADAPVFGAQSAPCTFRAAPGFLRRFANQNSTKSGFARPDQKYDAHFARKSRNAEIC